ncbi:hypothetical protein MHU86_23773 [Fragilaria crotonensis]|nr:hypothetical protein MHU86_23773 [Fragilaria crotonensis]
MTTANSIQMAAPVPGTSVPGSDNKAIGGASSMNSAGQSSQPPQNGGGGPKKHTTSLKRYSTHAYIMTFPREMRNLLAGGVAGMVAKSIVAPVDRIKILYQVSSRTFRLGDVPRIATKIITDEGFSALWKGNTATMIRVFPYSGIQFMVFDRCKTFFLHKHSQSGVEREWGLSPMESLLSGSVAGICSAACTYPLDMTRAQLAVLKSKKHARNVGFVGILVKNYKERGFVGLYRGITPTLLGILPYAGIAFTLNEQAKRRIQNLTGHDPTTMQKIQCGAISGLFAQTLTYPLEVIRRRMQTMGVASGKDAAVGSLGLGHAAVAPPNDNMNMVSTVRGVLSEQGMRGLFKGVTLNWLKGPIAFSISFTTFDIMQGLLETESERTLRSPTRQLQASQQ